MYGCGKDCLILISFRLPQISCFTLSLKCFSSDSDSCLAVGIRPLHRFPYPLRAGPVLLTLLFPLSYRVLHGSNTLPTWCEELTHLKSPWCWERLKAGAEGDDKGWYEWMASPTQWTWVWVNPRSWWWTGRPDVLQSMGSDRTEWLNWTDIFFSTGQVLLSTLSWCSACTSVSEGVFLMYLRREMYSMSTYSSAILFSQWCIFDSLHNPDLYSQSEQLFMGYCGSLQDWEGKMSPMVVWLMEMNNTHTKGKGGGPDGQRKTWSIF